LLVLALGLVGWHAVLSHRSGARPTALERRAPLLDVNSASAVELRHLPGVGEKLAQRIVAERRQRPFRDVDDLRRVKGIGKATLEQIRPFVQVRRYNENEGAPKPAVVRGARPDEPAVKEAAAGGGKKKPPRVPLDINRASAQQMRDCLPGIGPTLAKRIVEERQRRPFHSVDELRRVKGIGARILDGLRPHVTVSPP
jgi:competence protein ComEA